MKPKATSLRHLALIAFLLGSAVAAIAAPSPTGRNPKMFWTPERQDVWNKMRAENHPWWQLIKSNADRSATPTERYNECGRWGTLAYQITGDVAYARKALASYEKCFTFTEGVWGTKFSHNETREYPIEMVMMYDWLYPALTPAERTAWINQLNFIGDLILDKAPIHWGTILSDSDEAVGHYFGLALIDIVTAPDNPRAGTFLSSTWPEPYEGTQSVGGLDATGSNLKSTMRNAVHYFVTKLAAGGHWIESSDYNIGTPELLLMGYEGLRTATGVEHFPEIKAFLKDLAVSFMSETTPDLKDSYQWGDIQGAHELSFYARGALYSTIAGLTQNDPQIGPQMHQHLLDIRAANSTDAYVIEPWPRYFYFYNPYAATAPWRDTVAPKTFVALGQGLYFSRTGWTAGSSFLGVHFPTPPEVDHSVNYSGDFQLYRKGSWAVIHPIGYGAHGGLARPDTTNIVLVANHGSSHEARGIIAEESDPTGSYRYVAGTTAGASHVLYPGYSGPPPTYMHENTRSLFYLPSNDDLSDTVVVFDRVHAEDPRDLPGFDRYYPNIQTDLAAMRALKEWLIHMPVQPTVTENSISWPVSNYTVRVDALLPASSIKTVFDVNTLTVGGGYWPAGEKKFQARISPPVKRPWDTFLNVISAFDPGASINNQNVPSSNGLAQGVQVDRSNHNNVVIMFGAKQGAKVLVNTDASGRLIFDASIINEVKTQRLVTAGYEFTYSATSAASSIYLADLKPTTQWFITIDGQAETVLPVSSQGIGKFAISGTGTHTVAVRAGGQTTPPPTVPACGDLACNGTETCGSCSQDCGVCPAPPTTPSVCGDLVCSGGETCTSCSQDCGVCPATPVCGDLICSGAETCTSCSQDCGSCSTPGSSLPSPDLRNFPSSMPLNESLNITAPVYQNVSFRWTFIPVSGNLSGGDTAPAAGAGAGVSFMSSGSRTDMLTTYGLQPRTYRVQVQAVDNTDETRVSPTASRNIVLTSDDLAGIRVFPNPWRKDRHATESITFDGLPLGATIKLFTVSGHHVRTLTANADTAIWDLKNSKDDQVASGIYLYVITADGSDSDQKTRGKIAVIR